MNTLDLEALKKRLEEREDMGHWQMAMKLEHIRSLIEMIERLKGETNGSKARLSKLN